MIRIIRQLLFCSITKYTSNKTAHCHTRLAKLERNYHINRLMFRTRHFDYIDPFVVSVFDRDGNTINLAGHVHFKAEIALHVVWISRTHLSAK